MIKKGMNRRQFLKRSSLVVGAASLGLGGRVVRASEAEFAIKTYRLLGKTGFKVSDIGFGAGPLKDSTVLKYCLERGMNYIDTAQSYGKGASEEAIGDVLTKWKQRDKLFITTKFSDAAIYDPKNLKKNLKKALDESLRRMKTDYVDALMIHGIDGGRGNAGELKTAAADNPELYSFIDDVKKNGKLRFFGLSSHSDYKTLKTVLKYPKYYQVSLYPYTWVAEGGEGLEMLKKCQENGVGLTLMKTRTGCLKLNIRGIDKVKVDEENPYRSKFTKEYLENAIIYVNNQPLTDTTLVSIKNFEDADWALNMSGKKYK